MENRWAPSELSGGKFCEIVYTILDGFSTGNYTSYLQSHAISSELVVHSKATLPIPGVFKTLSHEYYKPSARSEIIVVSDLRLARSTPIIMDATAVLHMTSWIMAELIRVFHNLSIEDAKKLTDSLVDRRTPLVWQSGDIRRVLKSDLTIRDQILLLLSSSSTPIATADLLRWIAPSNRSYFRQVLRNLHKSRLVELSFQ